MRHHYFPSFKTDIAASAIEFPERAMDRLVSGQRASGLKAFPTFRTGKRHVPGVSSNVDSIVMFAFENFRTYRAFEAIGRCMCLLVFSVCIFISNCK